MVFTGIQPILGHGKLLRRIHNLQVNAKMSDLAYLPMDFVPFNMNVPHSTWPVVLVPYNLTPWLCVKQH